MTCTQHPQSSCSYLTRLAAHGKCFEGSGRAIARATTDLLDGVVVERRLHGRRAEQQGVLVLGGQGVPQNFMPPPQHEAIQERVKHV